MSIQSSLDYKALDKTWNMISSVRNMFTSGVLEKGGELEITSTQIKVKPYVIFGIDGVLIWDDDEYVITRPSVDNKEYYVYIQIKRTSSSGLGSPIISIIDSDNLPDPFKSSGYVSFGSFINSNQGVIDPEYGSKRTSVTKVGHNKGRWRGFYATLPDVNTSDLQEGDCIVTISSGSTKAYLNILSNGVFYALTAGSSGDIIILGSDSAKQITLNGITGKITLGTKIIIDAAGSIESSSLKSSKLELLNPGSGNFVGDIIPITNNLNVIGTSSKKIKKVSATDLYASTLIESSGSISASNNISGSNLTAGNNVQGSNLIGKSLNITESVISNLSPSQDNSKDLGTVSKNWKDGYIKNVYIKNNRFLYHPRYIEAGANELLPDLYNGRDILSHFEINQGDDTEYMQINGSFLTYKTIWVVELENGDPEISQDSPIQLGFDHDRLPTDELRDNYRIIRPDRDDMAVPLGRVSFWSHTTLGADGGKSYGGSILYSRTSYDKDDTQSLDPNVFNIVPDNGISLPYTLPRLMLSLELTIGLRKIN